ncbi:hypothetical protein VKT23_020040 [Stygiomarasmius scandens]|uniref:Huntingtin n=1 Tax=Marasmiellus scandens TaxID=2682957 RepID=A0ABR1IJX0_9AGAR
MPPNNDNNSVRLKINSITRALRSIPPDSVVPAHLTPNAKDALYAIHSLVELLDSHRITSGIILILSKINDHWHSLWAWFSVFIDTCSLETESAVDISCDFFSQGLVDIFEVLSRIMNPYQLWPFQSELPQPFRSRTHFILMVHSSRGFYPLLVQAITFASLHSEDLDVLRSSVLEVFHVLVDNSSDSHTPFLTAMGRSSYSTCMPSLLLSPLSGELLHLRAKQIRARKLFLSTFTVDFMFKASNKYIAAYIDTPLFLNLLQHLVSSTLHAN